MKKIHDENLKNLSEDPDFAVEEIMTGDEGEGEMSPSPSGHKNKLPVLVIILACFCGFLCLLPVRFHRESKRKETETKITEETVSVTEVPKETKEEETALPVPETETEKIKPEQPAPDLSWQDEIFGIDAGAVMTWPVKISGLTENEKNLISFRESDFVKSVTSFLSGNNITCGAISFTGSIACSAPEAAAYMADLKGISDRKLVSVFFPKYPGRYLFMLQSVSNKEKETERQTTASPRPQVQAQPLPSAPISSQEETQSAYDAMRLSVKGLSGELSNYLSNPYELQYSLYDYLYGRGIRNARTATVTDYYIDPDDRTASIQIDIEGVGKVTAIYDRDGNGYSFQ